MNELMPAITAQGLYPVTCPGQAVIPRRNKQIPPSRLPAPQCAAGTDSAFIQASSPLRISMPAAASPRPLQRQPYGVHPIATTREHRPAMHLGDRLDDGQAQPVIILAVGSRRVSPVEAVEQPGQV